MTKANTIDWYLIWLLKFVPPIPQCNGWQVLKVTWPWKWLWQKWFGDVNGNVIHTLCYGVRLQLMWKVFYQLLCGNSLKGYLRYPVMWYHDRYSWWMSPIFWYFLIFFWFSFFSVQLGIIPSTCYYGFVSMRGLTEYCHVNGVRWPGRWQAMYHAMWCHNDKVTNMTRNEGKVRK